MILNLKENEFSDSVRLTYGQVDALRSIVYRSSTQVSSSRVLEIQPGKREGEYYVGARDIVGSFNADGVEVFIEPKCGNNLLANFLLSTTPTALSEQESVNLETGPLRESLATQFLFHLEKAASEGAFETYRRTTSTGYRPKGQINFTKVLSGLHVPVAYSHDAFTSMNTLNAYLAAVLDTITRTSAPTSSTGSLAKIWADNLGVPPLLDPLDALDEAIELAPDDSYLACIKIGALILQGRGLITSTGETPSRGLLFQMPRVFESFVTALLSFEANSLGISCDIQGRSELRFLDVDETLRLMPDLCIGSKHGAPPKTIIDAKYKWLGATPARADIYQMLAYCEAYQAESAVLIGLGEGPDTSIALATRGLKLHSVRISFEDSAPTINGKIKSVLSRISTLA